MCELGDANATEISSEDTLVPRRVICEKETWDGADGESLLTSDRLIQFFAISIY